MSAPVATNKKAYHNFFLTEKWECGIALNGGEVKSIRAGEVNFKDSYARFEQEEIFLYNLHINPYLQAVTTSEPDRPRKLLLHKREIKRIKAHAQEKHLALVPTKIYFNARGYVKIEIALGQGKKNYDKRETMKKRDIDQSLKRTLKTRRG
jgi:SsrA-binding protein